MSKVVHQNAADSYGVVAKQQAATGTKSDTLLTPFRNYNNYVKKALVQRSMSLLLEPSTSAATAAPEMSLADVIVEGQALSITIPSATTTKMSAGNDANADSSSTRIFVPASATDQCLHRRLLSQYTSSASLSSSNNDQQKDGKQPAVVLDGFSVLDIASGRGGDLQKWLYGQHPAVSALPKTRDHSKQVFSKNEENIEDGREASLSSSWICNAPKDHPVYVSNVISVDISPGAVEVGLNRFKAIVSVDVAPGTKIHDSMVKNFREGRELPPAQFYVSNCLSPAFWNDVPISSTPEASPTQPPAEDSGAPVAAANPNPTDSRLRQASPDQCSTISDVRHLTKTLLRRDDDQQVLRAADCSSTTPTTATAFPVDIISVQFAFHYACETEDGMRANLAGMLSTLIAGKGRSIVSLGASGGVVGVVPRGVLVLTTVDAVAITQRLRREYHRQQQKLSDAASGSSGEKNDCVTYTSKLFSLVLPVVNKEIQRVLSMEDVTSNNTTPLPLGTRYHFKLDGHVDCDEFVVPYGDLVDAATTIKNTPPTTASSPSTPSTFTLLESHSFVDSKQYLHEFNTTPKYKRQMDGKSLDDGDLDLIGIYRTYVFGAY